MSRGGRGKISRFVRDDKRVLFVESFGENQDKLARNLFGMLRLMADWKLNHYPKLVLKSPKWGCAFLAWAYDATSVPRPDPVPTFTGNAKLV
jgi:hypothetical protein